MKKIFTCFSLLLFVAVANAQSDSLQQYTGKYKFPDGSPVTEITVILDSTGLTAASAMGNSELRKTDTKDVFDIVAYNGIATFKRNDDGKITALRIQVQDVDMEGTRQDGFTLKQGLSHFFPTSFFR